MADRTADLREVSSNRCFAGVQKVLAHDSEVLGVEMRLGVYLPPQVTEGGEGDCPVLFFLSGLTCTEQNVITKAGAQQWCAEHGLILVAPDTSPRGEGVANDEAYDLGQGAGFYVDATQAPWAPHFRMATYITHEVVALTAAFTSSRARGVTGHSMGGHGALVLALRHPGLFRSVSAFAPIVNPSAVPWGEKAFTAYLGSDREAWAQHDATRLLASVPAPVIADLGEVLIDQGRADGFLAEQLDGTAFRAAAEAVGCRLTYRLQPGYDHSYYFVSTFMRDHVAHHARALRGA